MSSPATVIPMPVLSRVLARARSCPAPGPEVLAETGYAIWPTKKIARHATATAATASAAASTWTARGAGLPAVRKTPHSPVKPKTAIWMVCHPRAEAVSSFSGSVGEIGSGAVAGSAGSISLFYRVQIKAPNLSCE